MNNHLPNTPKNPRYSTFRDARAAYPYAARVTAAGKAQMQQHHADSSVWFGFARQLDSGEVEILLDGSGSIYRTPGSWFDLLPPPEERENQIRNNHESISAWDQVLEQT